MHRALAVLLLLLPVAAHALETAPVKTGHTIATLLSEPDSVAASKPFRIALRLTLAPGWHTYWLNPGDAGTPPEIDLTGATAGPIAYPTPSHTSDGTFTSFEYTNEVLLPLTVTPPAKPGPLHLAAHASWLVCAKICVPEEAAFTLDLPQGSGA
ncbi:MAG TPA: protein-disulfide reductase DsbD domain-containing protein, partial [Acetobacteraceae bacterium]|nr:protein-disulfide reductase DsbD domain-containing protein [Acetobacteraceae bacterium]